ncbi:hypothetical protein GSI_05328 [Ganoderma sinense ZZ0214-1]|uniref:Uncharacterized protein n=1 Tax=Ganoderma sinense ZZ0214-1 TaxID=1077348 RepID=A0A2G8SFS0_9APHY|nr:hypothetical protein GSI_05328 [Ganoderma sinense ZZ0214-1]
MSDGIVMDSPTTNVYTLDAYTGKLSYAIVRLPSSSGSYPAGSEASSYTPTPIDAGIHLSEGSISIVEEVPIRNGQSVYFVAKLDPRALSSQGSANALDACIRRTRRQITEMERLVWQLEAALKEEDRSSESDYEADIDEPEDEAVADSGYESDDEGIVELCGVTTRYPHAPYVDEDSQCPLESEGEGGSVGTRASTSLCSDPSDELVTFDPPSSPVSSESTGELAPSTASAIRLSAQAQAQIPSPSVSACSSDDYSAIEDPSTLEGDGLLPSMPQLESTCGDDSLVLQALPDRLGPGCPPTKEDPICPACYGEPIRLVWGDESSDESLSDLVDGLLGECDLQLDELEVGQDPTSVDVPAPSPIIAAEWSLSQALASKGTGGEAKAKGLSGAGSTSSSAESLFSESQEYRAELDSESEEEPLAETIKRRRETGKAPEPDESVEIPLSALHPLRVKKKPRAEEGQPHPPATGQSTSAGLSAPIQQEEASPPRTRKRRRDDEKEEGEISESESDSGSEPDIPLAQVVASRRRSQSTLGHGPPPAKRRRCIQHHEGAEQHRVSSRECRTPRRSWVHRRWEERLRLRLRYARGGREGRRGIRIMSTDEELIRRGMRAAERAAGRREERHYGSV